MTEIKPTIAIIVAALKPNAGIGFQGKMPWRLRKEIKYFKDVTSKVSSPKNINAVVMGRKTWESIPKKFRPLPDRINVILSRSYNNEVVEPGVIHANSISNSLPQLQTYCRSEAQQLERIFIIGGAEIYNELINDSSVSHLLITEIEHTNHEAPLHLDTFLNFPIYSQDSVWKKQPTLELKSFIGEDIPLEEDITEGDFVYNYTLWTRK